MENALDLAGQAHVVNQNWVVDFTYSWTAGGWLYVAVIIQPFSQHRVGWSMKDAVTA